MYLHGVKYLNTIAANACYHCVPNATDEVWTQILPVAYY
jgi:hypothetical protein